VFQHAYVGELVLGSVYQRLNACFELVRLSKVSDELIRLRAVEIDSFFSLRQIGSRLDRCHREDSLGLSLHLVEEKSAVACNHAHAIDLVSQEDAPILHSATIERHREHISPDDGDQLTLDHEHWDIVAAPAKLSSTRLKSLLVIDKQCQITFHN